MEHNATIAGGVTLVSSTVYLALTGKHQMLILDIVMFPALILMVLYQRSRKAMTAGAHGSDWWRVPGAKT